MESRAILVNNLHRSFGSLQAVDDLSFEVPSGIIFGFLGPNGAGKTTTIRLLLGLLEPTSGNASVLGLNVRSQSHDIRRRTGALLEHTGLYERLSGEDNLEFYARIWGLPTHEKKTRIRELLTSMELWERRKEMVGTWSRGMKQKLAVARALLHRPALVFLDEPTAGLDPVAATSLRAKLSELSRREGTTVFLTTHNLSEAEKLCDRVGVIRNGRLIALDSPENLRSDSVTQLEIRGSGFSRELLSRLRQRPEIIDVNANNNHLRIDLRENTSAAPLVEQLVTAGARIEEVTKVRSSLEEVFLELMEEKD